MSFNVISVSRRATALFAGIVALAASGGFAGAQYYSPGPGYYEGGPRYYRERPRYSDRGDFSNVCVTSRGNCRIRPAPLGYPCRCDIPDFGRKRGRVGGV